MGRFVRVDSDRNRPLHAIASLASKSGLATDRAVSSDGTGFSQVTCESSGRRRETVPGKGTIASKALGHPAAEDEFRAVAAVDRRIAIGHVVKVDGGPLGMRSPWCNCQCHRCNGNKQAQFDRAKHHRISLVDYHPNPSPRDVIW